MPRKKKIAQTSLFSFEDPSAKEVLIKEKKISTKTKSEKKSDQDTPRRESAVFSVADYLTYLGDLVGAEGAVVQGEISGYKAHPSGAYFSLKDQDGDGLLNCYMSPRHLYQLGFDLEDGLLVQATGLAGIYRPQGKLSFSVSRISLVGDGSLRQAYEALKKKLEEEGLFARKRALPEFIYRIGLVTAKTGEVIHDFRRNLKTLGFEIDFVDVRVQGSDAPLQIVKALEMLNTQKEVEVIVVMRGGGSLEDLQAFNDERVARAIFKSDIPVLAAIGHARDIPIAYMVADAAADTPTAAAVVMNRSWERLENSLPFLRGELIHKLEIALGEKRNEASVALERLLFGIDRLLQIPREFRKRLTREIQAIEKQGAEIRLMARREILHSVQSLMNRVRQIAIALTSSSNYLEGVSPERNLRLGYSIVRNQAGRVVRETNDLTVGEKLSTLLADGSFVSKVETVDKKNTNND